MAERTLDYFKNHYKKVKIENFYDKQFVDRMKIIIKNQAKFEKFLQYINMDLREFITIGVYVFPQCFSSSIIKLLKTRL